MKQQIPNYVAVEGVIGVGKTSLAKRLAERFHANTVLEEVETNPFLSGFYGDRRAYAFQTQLLTDYLFAKDRIFAYLNLDRNELSLYETLWKLLEQKAVRPDLVVYLQADLDTLMRRIRERGRSFEHGMSRDYLSDPAAGGQRRQHRLCQTGAGFR